MIDWIGKFGHLNLLKSGRRPAAKINPSYSDALPNKWDEYGHCRQSFCQNWIIYYHKHIKYIDIFE